MNDFLRTKFQVLNNMIENVETLCMLVPVDIDTENYVDSVIDRVKDLRNYLEEKV